MAAAIRETDIAEALRPWLGTVFINSTDIVREAAARLGRYSPYRQSLDELRDALDRYVFGALHQHLGVGMTARLDDGRIRRILVKDIERLTDDLMGVLFDSLAVYSVNYELLNAYALSHESLSSLRVLYQKYSEHMTADERATMVSVIRDVYPAERYAAWLERSSSHE